MKFIFVSQKKFFSFSCPNLERLKCGLPHSVDVGLTEIAKIVLLLFIILNYKFNKLFNSMGGKFPCI